MRSVYLAAALTAGVIACGEAPAPKAVDPVAEAAAPAEPTALEAAENRYRKARVVDLQRPLMLVPGAPLCADKADAQAYFTGQPHGCLSAPESVPVTVIATAAIGEQDFHQVRAPNPAGAYWIPTDGVTNDLDELKAAFDALNAANGGQIAP